MIRPRHQTIFLIAVLYLFFCFVESFVFSLLSELCLCCRLLGRHTFLCFSLIPPFLFSSSICCNNLFQLEERSVADCGILATFMASLTAALLAFIFFFFRFLYFFLFLVSRSTECLSDLKTVSGVGFLHALLFLSSWAKFCRLFFSTTEAKAFSLMSTMFRLTLQNIFHVSLSINSIIGLSHRIQN